MDIFDDVKAARLDIWEQEPDTDLLFVHGMPAVVEDDIELPAELVNEQFQLRPVGLVGHKRGLAPIMTSYACAPLWNVNIRRYGMYP